MINLMCEICGVRRSVARVAIVQNQERRILDVCEFHFERLLRHQRTLSPLEALFRTDLGGRVADDAKVVDLSTSTAGDSDSMYINEYFSDVVKELLQRAAKRALEFGRSEVDTEHLFYELLVIPVVADTLNQLHLSPTDIQKYIDETAPKHSKAVNQRDHKMLVSPRLKSVLQIAYHEARRQGLGYVGPEHLMIALSAVPDSFAGNLLRKLGANAQVLRQSLQQQPNVQDTQKKAETSTTPHLDRFSRDLTSLAREGRIDPVIGRSVEIETMIEILARRRKNNPVLIGEPGVGKTAIVEGLAVRMVKGDVPDSLRDKRLIELNINSMVAGSKYRGEFEERVQQLIDEILKNRDALVIFVDEVHTIVGAGQGGGEGGLDIANVFKPAMARGELNLIGATTLAEYQKHIESDSALERRFQPILVSEPTVEQSINILRGLRDRFEGHHHVTIQDDAIVAAATLSDRYVAGRFLPDKAIDLVDQAAARVHLSATSRPADILEFESELAQMKREQDYAATRKLFERAHALDSRIKDKEKALADATDKWKSKVSCNTSDVSATQIAEIVAKLTGIPVAQLTAAEREHLMDLEGRLHHRVIGQDEAVRAVSDAVRRARAGLQSNDRPIAVFLFLGPTGVGKTELAKALAEVVFGDEDALIRLDMSEYMERHAVARLMGSPPGYVGYDEGGQLTEKVRRRPYSVILFDEIEKAHPDVYNVLLQVFDDGRLTDGKGRVVDFSNTLMIATSNLGADIIGGHKRAGPGFMQDDASPSVRSGVMGVLRQHFRPEFINRIDDIIIFEALGKKETLQVVRLQLEQVKRIASSQDIEIAFSEEVVELLAKVGYRPEFGARELRRQIRQLIENELARRILDGTLLEGKKVMCELDSESHKITFRQQALPQSESTSDVPPADVEAAAVPDA
jgi:ATP-dependent Clp protease ATP-binding subunit ClpC